MFVIKQVALVVEIAAMLRLIIATVKHTWVAYLVIHFKQKVAHFIHFLILA